MGSQKQSDDFILLSTLHMNAMCKNKIKIPVNLCPCGSKRLVFSDQGLLAFDSQYDIC